MTVEELLKPAINTESPFGKQLVSALQDLIDDETVRCDAIVHAARNGDIDGDFRSISHRIMSGCVMNYDSDKGEYREETN